MNLKDIMLTNFKLELKTAELNCLLSNPEVCESSKTSDFLKIDYSKNNTDLKLFMENRLRRETGILTELPIYVHVNFGQIVFGQFLPNGIVDRSTADQGSSVEKCSN
jgi:hypothetical protein